MQKIKAIKDFFVGNKYLKYLWNKYAFVLLIFIIWIVFLDNYSLLEHKKLNKKIKTLEDNKVFFEKEIKRDSSQINDLKNPQQAERFARQQYYFKKENEDIYIIEVDTIIK